MSATPLKVPDARPAGLPSHIVKRPGGLPAPSTPPLTLRTSTTSGTSTAPGVLKKSDSIHFTEDTENFKVGDRVWVGGTKPGRIQYLGETQFAPGEWAGVVLDEPLGKNDGTVNGVKYFQCETNKGTFVRLHKLSTSPLSKEEIEAIQQQRLSTATSTASIPQAVDGGNLTPDNMAGSGLKIGMRVWLSGDRSGIIRFLGTPHFQQGIWAGIELDEAKGKNDGSVDDQRYFSCKPGHGVFAPIAKVSKVPLPGPASGMSVNRLKRSPSQESIVSSYSVKSTASRRTGGIRLGTSSLSPATVTVARTGAGTPADIIKAHQEKDSIIANVTRERDRLKKELEAKSTQEKDVHVEIQKLQGQYVSALSAQEARIAELTESVRQLAEEKSAVQELLEDEKRKLEDLQFRFEEELMTKESAGDADQTQRLLHEKAQDVTNLRNELADVLLEVERLRGVLEGKDLEINGLRNLSQVEEQREVEITADRDKIAFEVADLSRRLRDAAEKHEQEVAKLQQEIQIHVSSESNLHAELIKLRSELANSNQKSDQERHLVDQLKSKNESLQSELEKVNQSLSQMRIDSSALVCRCQEFDSLQNEFKQYNDSLMDVLRDLGEPIPEDFGNVVISIKSALNSFHVESARLTKELSEKSLSAEESKLHLLNLEKQMESLRTDVKTRTANLEVMQNEAAEASNQMKKLTGENETLVYQLSELGIELNELRNSHQELVEQSAQKRTNATESRDLELDQLMRNHEADIEKIKQNFQEQQVDLVGRLERASSDLETAVKEKTELHKEIGQFIEVLKAKDAELKEARDHIERSFVSEHEEKAKLCSLMNHQKEKGLQLEQEMESLKTELASKNRDFADLNHLFLKKEREIAAVKEELCELREKCQKLETEAERTQTAFAEQMMLAEIRREEQAQKLISERATTVNALEQQVSVLSADKSTEVDALQAKLNQKLLALQSDLLAKTSSLEAAEKQARDLAVEFEASKTEAASFQSSIQKLQLDLRNLQVQNAELVKERSSTEEQIIAVGRLTENLSTTQEQLAQLTSSLEQKEREITEVQENLNWSNQRIKSMEAESAEASTAYAEQMALAQFRLKELHSSVEEERNSLAEKIQSLENQISVLLKENTFKVDSVTDELNQKVVRLETELAIKISRIESTESDLSLTKSSFLESQGKIEELSRTLRTMEAQLGQFVNEAKHFEKERSVLQEKLNEAETSVFQSKEELLRIKKEKLETETELLSKSRVLLEQIHLLEKTATDSNETTVDLQNRLKNTESALDESRRRCLSSEEELRTLRLKSADTRALESEIENLSREKVILQQNLDSKTISEMAQNFVIEELKKEIVQLKESLEDSKKIVLKAPADAETINSGRSQERELDELLERELARVRSEVEHSKRQIEQKDMELSKVKQQTRQLIEQKDTEITQMKARALQTDALVRKEKLEKLSSANSLSIGASGDSSDFHVQILNSIIADQQKKIEDLEDRLLSLPSSEKLHPSSPSQKESDLTSNGRRKAIRLYCGTCLQFDLHDSLECPKRKTSPERKAKATSRPRRKFCEACDVFDKHDTSECPNGALLKSS